ARLSRELDARLSERIDALARLAASRGGDPVATFAAIEAGGRAALNDMRETVGVLREGTPLGEIRALVARAAGAHAQLMIEGGLRVLPAAVELSAYRIIEQLLDALDDAAGVQVRVRFLDAALELTVFRPAGRRARAAIDQARDRARQERGTL